MQQPQKSHEQNILPKHLQMDELIFVPYKMHAMNYCFCVFGRGNWMLTSTTYQDHRENILSVVYQRWKVLVLAFEAENKISDILPQNPHQSLEDPMPLWTYLSFLLQPLILERLSLRKVKKKPSRFHSLTKLQQGAVRKLLVSLLTSSPFGVYREKQTRERRRESGGWGGGGGEGRSPLPRSLACSRAVRFAPPNRKACLQANL